MKAIAGDVHFLQIASILFKPPPKLSCRCCRCRVDLRFDRRGYSRLAHIRLGLHLGPASDCHDERQPNTSDRILMVSSFPCPQSDGCGCCTLSMNVTGCSSMQFLDRPIWP